ncbi:lysin [Lactococcus lactis subsp. lactis 1AA59]|uniref:peptidoglycan recognition protein family protein n=1 Tax=Lactococcus lactis TaxID=1358 RepID=UPI000537E8B0|nr:N-acetylmuramoyl-L-alanine amidase [Lactococcus lactis]KHE75992.1 lysin [Lactococcus lactis subsp. lactis 1AA59]
MTIYDKTFLLGTGQGSSQKASNQYIVIHDTANDNNQGDNSATNEASYMHNNWQNAYTHAIAGWDKVYLVGEPGYVAYGAGSPANERSPFQIELSHYSDPTKQRSSYINYINAVREQAKVFGIPLTLDGAGNGIKTHKWVSDNLWGDHQDPYSYLTRIGISKDQLAKDLANGIGGASKSNQSNNDDSTPAINYTPNMEEKKMLKLFRVAEGEESLRVMNTVTGKSLALNKVAAQTMRDFMKDEPKLTPAQFKNLNDILRQIS